MSDISMDTGLRSQQMAKAKQRRQRSAIAFAYIDLEDTMTVANAIHEHVGNGDCDEHQLSAWIGKSNKSSTFRILLSTARLFGIIEPDGEHFKLTPLGRRAVDPTQARDARAKAFLAVPLYSAIFEKYKGGVLPPPSALERELAQIGVAEKQIRTARLVMERSAQYANFTEHGRDRWVMPGIAPTDRSEMAPNVEERRRRNGGDDGGHGPELDPLIAALIQKLPSAGTAGWPIEARVMWLQMAAMAFEMAYGQVGGIQIRQPEESGETK